MIYLSMLNYQRDLESNEYIPLVSNIYCFSTMLESWIMLPGHDCWRMAVKNRKQRYTWIDHDLTVMPERCWMDSGHHPQMADNSYFQFSGWWITLFGQNIYIYIYTYICIHTIYILPWYIHLDVIYRVQRRREDKGKDTGLIYSGKNHRYLTESWLFQLLCSSLLSTVSDGCWRLRSQRLRIWLLSGMG